MGYAKNMLIEKMEHERYCPECSSTVWVKWGESPNVHCEDCETNYDVVQCENCSNLIHSDNNLPICSDCFDQAMED